MMIEDKKNKAVTEITEQLKKFSTQDAEIILLKVLSAIKELSTETISRQPF